MTANEDRWISTDKRSGKLALRFRAKGYQKQFFIASGLSDSKRNRELVRMRRDIIQTDIALDRFDHTLESYQFRAKAKILAEPKKTEKYKYNLLELWNKFSDYQETQIEQTTILNRYTAILRYTKKLPTFSLEESPQIRDWLTKNTTKQMAWLVISHYIQCCDWATDSQLIPDNPFAKFKIKESKKKRNEDYKAFTLEQRDLIIEAFQNHPRFSHFTNLIKFLFWTGCRPGEAFALTWGDISDNGRSIKIDKSCNLHNILKSTKTGRSRIFPPAIGSKLQQLLIATRPIGIDPKQLVFTQDNKPIKSWMVQKAWKGYTQLNRGCYEYPGVVQELVTQGKLAYYLKPYATRHTFATWAITQGVSPDKVAKWIGDKVETVLRYYCHPEVVNADCPDF